MKKVKLFILITIQFQVGQKAQNGCVIKLYKEVVMNEIAIIQAYGSEDEFYVENARESKVLFSGSESECEAFEQGYYHAKKIYTKEVTNEQF